MVLWASESDGHNKANIKGVIGGVKKAHFYGAYDMSESHRAELTVSFQLFLQPADLAWSCFFRDGLYLLGPGSYL